LAPEIVSHVLLFLEANALLTVDEKERYSRLELDVWKQVSEAIAKRSPVTLDLKKDDPDRTFLAHKESQVA